MPGKLQHEMGSEVSLYQYEDEHGNFLDVSQYEGFEGDGGDRVLLHSSDSLGLVDVQLPPIQILKLIKALEKGLPEWFRTSS